MAQKIREVDTYIHNLNSDRQAALETLRSLVFKVVPAAVETMEYRMPTYEYNGGKLCAFASQKNYISLYIMDTEIVEKYREELSNLNVGKSCIRFTKLEKLPLQVVQSMLQEAVENR